jgi:hypothetical protein
LLVHYETTEKIDYSQPRFVARRETFLRKKICNKKGILLQRERERERLGYTERFRTETISSQLTALTTESIAAASLIPLPSTEYDPEPVTPSSHHQKLFS